LGLLKKSEHSILRFLAGNPGKTLDVVYRSTGVPPGSPVMSRLVELGFVSRQDDRCTLTEKGLATLMGLASRSV
jgi:DNA-binding IclR family transcriptional regulator